MKPTWARTEHRSSARACRGRFAGAQLPVSNRPRRKELCIWHHLVFGGKGSAAVCVFSFPTLSCNRENPGLEVRTGEVETGFWMGPVTCIDRSLPSVGFGFLPLLLPRPLPATFPGSCRSVCLDTVPQHSEPLCPQRPSLGTAVAVAGSGSGATGLLFLVLHGSQAKA